MTDASPHETAPLVRPIGCCADSAPPHFTLDAHPCGDGCEVLLPDQDEARARALLRQGASRVFVGEAALVDGSLVERLVSDFGSERIGLYVPARRMAVSWSLDAVSNADFKVVTPSLAAPAWEVLRADGRGSGTLAGWWIGAMVERGASAVLLRADIADDADLNLCAELQERLGERLWIGPLHAQDSDFAAWVRWGKATRLAVPQALLETNPALAALGADEQTT
ncbi:MAG: hypothetical protein AB1768_06750 [Pseudomonadota bacterium]|jgi:hypothetical protein